MFSQHFKSIFFKYPKVSFNCAIRQFSAESKLSKYLPPAEEFLKHDKLKIGPYNVNYLKVGHGPHIVFVFPGILGSMRSHLAPLIRGIDKEKFTLYTWDQPGYGFSRPPERIFTNKTFIEDVHLANEFMGKFGHDKFSVMGWSGGANSALMFPIFYPKKVNKIIPWGGWAYVYQDDADNFELVKDSDKYGGLMKDILSEEYGAEFFKREWVKWMDIFKSYNMEPFNGEVCAKFLYQIKCPTLIIHGEKDGLIFPKHGKFIHANIPDSKLIMWEGARHNPHLRYPEEFNAIIQKFLLE